MSLRLPRYSPLLIAALVLVIAALLPKSVFAGLDWVGYAVCHRIPQRSFIINQSQLPVCARDTGMFSGVLLGILYFASVLPTKAAQFPRRSLLLLLGLGFVAWGFDGVNSYVQLLRGEPLLYEPRNWLRLTTGAWMGVSLSVFVVALFNQAVWREQSEFAPVQQIKDILWLWLLASAIILIVLWQAPFLYGPIALTSALGVLVLLTIVNGLILLLVRKRHNQITRWVELLPYLALGLGLCVVEIAGIDLARQALTASLGLPF